MAEMTKYAMQYKHEQHNQGEVSKINDYSFWFTTIPKGKEDPKTCVVMKSWFLKL